MNSLKKAMVKIPSRYITSVILMLAVLMPIAAPIPAWAYSLNPSAVADADLFSSAGDTVLPADAPQLDNSLTSAFAAFLPSLSLAAAKKENSLNETTIKESLEKKVKGLNIRIKDRQTVKVGEILSLTGYPVDKDGYPVNGLELHWQSENPEVIKILNESQALVLREGETRLFVSIDKIVREISLKATGRNSHAESAKAGRPPDDPLPLINEQQAENRMLPENNLGTPAGQTEMSSSFSASALRTHERTGSSNYSFQLSAASISGRGIDANLGLVYNSRVWNKSTLGFGTRTFDFNVDQDWLAPGFELGYGSIERYGGSFNYGFLLTSPDGGRTQLILKQSSGGCSTYEAADGTFIQTKICGGYNVPTIVVNYTDGSAMTYGAITQQGKRFPTEIRDRNGNKITIAYVPNDSQGKIDYVRDTLNRYIQFHYDTTSDQKLVAVTVPGFNGSATPRQTIRFYYEDMTLQTQGRFEQPVVVNAPTTIKTLKFIYFPGTQTGYRFFYSPYFGSIYKISQRRSMQVSDTVGLSDTGTVTNEGMEAAWTQYNYPSTAMELGPPLTDVPSFSWRKDDWVGRTSDIAQTSFSSEAQTTPDSNGVPVGSRISTITMPDGTKNISVSNIRPPGDWENGLLSENRVSTIENGQERVWSKTKFYWQQGSNQPTGRDNPRPQKIELTNEAGQVRAISFEFDDYNNQTVVQEHDFAAAGTLGTVLRRTETTFENGEGWINNRLVHLPKVIKTIVGGVTAAKIAYEYDNYQANPLAFTPNVPQHSPAYNPYAPVYQCNCHWVCANGAARNPETLHCPDGSTPEWVCDECTDYQASTSYRGNVTKVTAFSDATAENDPNASVKTMKYDMTGNEIETDANCCDIKQTVYSPSLGYAYPTTESKGVNQEFLVTAAYDYNSGLVTSSTDGNGQTLQLTYNPDNLRLTRKDRPDGAFTELEYHDELINGPAGRSWSYVKTTLKIDTNKQVSGWQYFDGRGLLVRRMGAIAGGTHLGVSDIEYDNMNRATRSSNPYEAVDVTSAINPANLWASRVYDALGRATLITLPDNTSFQTQFNGTVITVIDQGGKKRRQVTNALNELVHLDEPDASGNLGDINSPTQPTSYEYDGNRNLTKVTQSVSGVTQQRIFKYDSLARLTHENQPEMTATLNNNGEKVTSGGSWTGVYKYNSQGLLEEGIDSRGVTSRSTYDAFSRLKKIEYFGETGYQTPTAIYTYDEARQGYFNKGRLTKAETLAVGSTPATAEIIDYDRFGRTAKQVQQFGGNSYTTKYWYNMIGDLVKEEYPSGKAVEYETDSGGRLSKVSDSVNTYVNNFVYSSAGQLSSFQLGNGTSQNFTFNSRLQLTSQSLVKGSEVLQKYEYGYGAIDMSTGQLDPTKNSGELTRIDSYIGGTTGNPTKQWQQRFDYDSLGRLSEVREVRGDTGALTYKYKFDFDRFGNLYRKAVNNPTPGQENPQAFTPIEDSDIDKATNRLVSKTNAEVTYDESGNLTLDKKFRGRQFKYDAKGRMIWTKLADNTGLDATSVYDGLGQRVATKVNDILRVMVYDVFGQLVAEYGTVPIDDKGGLTYVFSDRQGSACALMKQNGFVTGRFDYQAFGEDINYGTGKRSIEQGYNADSPTRQRYGSIERDEATGLDHAVWRKNEARAGRWTSPDPYHGSIGRANPQSFNRYSYVGNDPVNFVDPSGLFWMINYGSCRLIGSFAYGPGEFPTIYEVYVCDLEWIGPYTGGPTHGGGGGGGQNNPPKPCDAGRTGNSAVDTITQILFAESTAGNEATYSMMAQTIANRTDMGLKEFGCDIASVATNLSVADDGNGNVPFNQAGSDESIKKMNEQQCQAFKTAQKVAQDLISGSTVNGTPHSAPGLASTTGLGTKTGGVSLWWRAGSRAAGDGRMTVGDTTFFSYDPGHTSVTSNDYMEKMNNNVKAQRCGN